MTNSERVQPPHVAAEDLLLTPEEAARTPKQVGTFKLPATIDVATAWLPAAYENAKTALAQCDAIDQCKEMADKAQALASYARQANDPELRQMADPRCELQPADQRGYAVP